MGKIKILLAGYVNYPNAQNVNCDNIAKYLNKNLFEVHVLSTSIKPIDKKYYKENNIHVHSIISHRCIWYIQRYLIMLFGKYDLYYLPKVESVDYKFVRKYKKKKCIISSVEGVVGQQIADDDIKVKIYYLSCTDIFSISECVKESVNDIWDKDTNVLYLGVNNIQKDLIKRKNIKKVAWIGSVINRKRPYYIIELAREFHNIEFYMIGDGEQLESVRDIVKRSNLLNCHCLGRIPNNEIYDVLRNMDLFVMTSDKEGLPKAIGEAMSCSIPAIYINECYNVDYIQDGINGYAVKNLEEMKEKIQYLLDNEDKYRKIQRNAYETIQDYTWDNLIKEYEDYFIMVYKEFIKGNENDSI